jgi:transcriptional regulator with XRE-family HTH domain
LAHLSRFREVAKINPNTVVRFENGRNTPNPVTLAAIRQAFEAAGIDFTENGGIVPPKK